MQESPSDQTRGQFDTSPDTFQQFLSRLKQQGSGLLVTGETPEWVQQHASRQLFGAKRLEGDEPPRRRLVVRTSSSDDPAKYLPTGTELDSDRVRVVSHAESTRSAAAASTPSGDVNGPTITDGPTDLAATVVDAIEGFTPAQDDVKPGELRVGVTSLRPLVEADGVDSVVDFCNTVANAVRSHSGMAHFHYPIGETDALTINLYETLDARIELRQGDGDPVQCRWHTPYPELNRELGWVDFG